MSESTSISSESTSTDLVSFKIICNGQQISGQYRVLSIEASQRFNKISYAKISLMDGDPSRQDFTISSKDDSLVPGNELEIQMGYHGKTKTVFKGLITKQSIRSHKNKSSALTLEAKDKSIQLTVSRCSGVFTDKTDTEIFEQLLKRAGFASKDFEMENTTVKHAEMVQYHATDWDFIVSRAEMNSMLVLTDNNQLVIKKPDTAAAPAKEITYGKEVIEFDSELFGDTQVKEVKSHAWSYKDQELETSDSGTTIFREAGNVAGETLADTFDGGGLELMHPGYLPAAELQSWSNARLLKSRMAKITGRIRIKGMTGLKPGIVLKLAGFGKRFNGNVYVTGISHSFNKTIWETEIIFGMSPGWFYEKAELADKAASGIVPGVNGLQIGLVTRLESDPEGEDRIQIKLPSLQTEEGIWARIATLDAGKDRGAFFRPELNDEVIVGFLNDDPRHAVVLGMLNSSAHPSPFTAKDVNHEKGFVTRSKMKLTFDDDKRKMVLETPAGKKIAIDEDGDQIIFADDHNNKIKLTDEGIIIESGKDISLKTASGDIKIEAVNIEMKASAKYSAQGAAGAELQSSGQTVVKGSIVNIN